MPPKTLVRLGLAFLLIAPAIYFLTGRWLDSRIFAPLDISLSLDSRQIKSAPFQINLRDSYFVSLGLDDSTISWDRLPHCDDSNLLGSEWRVYKLSSKADQPRTLWANSGTLEREYELYAYGINASSGEYELEWDFPQSADCLRGRHAHLMVQTGRRGYDILVAYTKICCVFFTGTGAVLILLAATRTLKPRLIDGGSPRMFPDMRLRNLLPVAKFRPLAPIHDIQHCGLFFVTLFTILVFIMLISGPVGRRGLLVTLQDRKAIIWDKSPWGDTLGVYVHAPARFFVNSTEVERSELRTKLLEQLGRRAEWTVYFEADADTMFMDSAYAIDTIQACGAKVVWVTPKMRKEFTAQTHMPAPNTRQREELTIKSGP